MLTALDAGVDTEEGPETRSVLLSLRLGSEQMEDRGPRGARRINSGLRLGQGPREGLAHESSISVANGSGKGPPEPAASMVMRRERCLSGCAGGKL